jgi:hypothetical protein
MTGTFIQLTPSAMPLSPELAQRLGGNHSGFLQQRLVGRAQVQTGSVVVYDNPSGPARIVGVLAAFDPGTATGAFVNSNQPTFFNTGGPHVEGGERWVMVTRVAAGRQLTLERWARGDDGGMNVGALAGNLEVAVLGDYDPEFGVIQTSPMLMFENRGPVLTAFSTLVMAMDAGTPDAGIRWHICPDNPNCAMPGVVPRNTLPSTMGASVPLNNTFMIWPQDLQGTISPLGATVSIRIEVPTTGPYRIIWNRL